MINGQNGTFKKKNENPLIFFYLYSQIFVKKIENLLNKKKITLFFVFLNNLNEIYTESLEINLIINHFQIKIKFLEKILRKKNKNQISNAFLKIKFLKEKKINNIQNNKAKQYLENEIDLRNINKNETVFGKNEKREEFIESKIDITDSSELKEANYNEKEGNKSGINFDELDIFLRKKKYLKYGGRLVFLKQKSKINRKKLKNHVEKFENFLNLNF